MDYIGQIDFTILSRLWKQHKDLFKEVEFKDGKHVLLDVSLQERKEADAKGNTHYLKARCKKDNQKEGVNYFIGSHFKPYGQQQQPQPVKEGTTVENEDELPF